MPVNRKNVVQCLQGFDFRNLFIEELGWDRPKLGDFTFEIKDENYRLTNISEKRSVQVFVCTPEEKVDYPDNTVRRRIESKVRKIAHEHLIIFIDREETIQRWQWVFRKAGQPAQYREHKFDKGQGSESLLQKLDEIEINIEDEEGLRLLDVAQKLKDAFDKDKVTKKFYDHFKTQQEIFRGFIENIPGEHDQNWYSAVMLNRMMFIYFIQKKNFLNGDANYLKTKLGEMKAKFGEDNYYTFYTHFLRRLFHEGLDGHTPRGQELDELLGTIPYLNGGIFGYHELEEKNPDIDIKDEAFVKLFAFFDQYQWHLDERPLMNDKEINPDVLGYIFEKFINQKDMGAYYTKEDITEYIGKNTIIPFLFDQAKTQCKIAFEGDHTLWDILKDHPDRYFYDAVKKGTIESINRVNGNGESTSLIQSKTLSQIPENIAIGLDSQLPSLLDRRKDWNTKTPEELALPTEIWRETIARWQRYFEVRQKVENGEIQSINDLITYNLNIRQFAQDVVETWEGPELIRAFYKAITKITVLDPTVGSGAFLFAALNILEPLYEACLNRMAEFMEDLPPDAPKSKFSDFKVILSKIDKHPSRSYFIYKTIIINNLYGVDIMDEAVEICKLRLFLKLVAQIDTVKQIDPLPDIDFNIRGGNTLVGFATHDEVKKAVTRTLDFDNNLGKITDKAEDVQSLYDVFLEAQMEEDDSVYGFKKELRNKLDELNNTLNHYLAGEYGIDVENKTKYENWLKTHQPFHWFVEFYGILTKGGFDVIIGNPPYLEINQIDYKPNDLKTVDSRAVHSMCIERSCQLMNNNSSMSMIVPLALISTQRMKIVQDLLESNRNTWYSNFAWRPAKLFDTVNRALTIFVVLPSKNSKTYSTNYQKWITDTRNTLIPKIEYVNVGINREYFWCPKLGNNIEKSILSKFSSIGGKLIEHTNNKGNCKIYYRTTGGLYWKVFTDFPPKFNINGVKGHSTRETSFSVKEKDVVSNVIASLSSNVFWWWYSVASNLRDLNPADIQNFAVSLSILNDEYIYSIGEKYLEDISKNSNMLIRNQKQTGITETQSFKISKSKSIIDEIDKVLAEHYGFTEEELDFIINYDIKYRMGKELNN